VVRLELEQEPIVAVVILARRMVPVELGELVIQ
jgi:hypothetical protein